MRVSKQRNNGRKGLIKRGVGQDVKQLKKKLEDENERRLLREPHSFVIHRGTVGKYVRKLVRDVRYIMEPFTASKLKVMKRNNLKDFIVNGSILGVTHLMVFTRSENHIMLRIIRSTQGPTLSFRIKNYTLARYVVSASKRKAHFQQLITNAPLVVMSGFSAGKAKHVHLMQAMFQNMFPTMNVDTVKLAEVRRCVLLNYNADDNTVDLRHYAIKAVPTGVSKSAKKLIQGKVPDLSKYKDIGDYFLNPGQLSESEYEFEQKEVELPQDLSVRGCHNGQKTNIRLYELGPRISLEIIKIEEGVDEGEVLYHSYINKTNKELAEIRKELPRKRKLKEKMRKNNEHRVIRRLKSVDEKRAEAERAMSQKKEEIIRKQKEVTGDVESDNQPLHQRVEGGSENQSSRYENVKRIKHR